MVAATNREWGRSDGLRDVPTPHRHAQRRTVPMTALLPAELAWYATGRFYRAADGTLADYGYFLHLPLPDAPLFDGKRGESTAHFTFAARPFKAHGVSNGSLSLGLDPV